ncbi:hypothetical protein HGRIS_002902 [Hohenbuehelia grisea]|uniref:Uncharacterized protein n=1 Tax=Hohenbuehelia grisea TaxID=104357 RepID=A0ABR3JMN3_9AGAR
MRRIKLARKRTTFTTFRRFGHTIIAHGLHTIFSLAGPVAFHFPSFQAFPRVASSVSLLILIVIFKHTERSSDIEAPFSGLVALSCHLGTSKSSRCLYGAFKPSQMHVITNVPCWHDYDSHIVASCNNNSGLQKLRML